MAPQGKQKMRWRKLQGRLLDQLQQEINAMIVDAVADAVADYPAGPSEEAFEEVLHLIRELQLQRHTDWQPSEATVQDALRQIWELDPSWSRCPTWCSTRKNKPCEQHM